MRKWLLAALGGIALTLVAAQQRYLRHAWPGTAIVIDDEEPEPRLVELLADLNPLAGGAGMPASQ